MNQYIITKEELNQIKNDCYHPNTLSCEECKFISAGINPCTWKGANALMDEVMTHPYQSERDMVLDDLQRFVREARSVNFQIGKRLVLNKIAELRAGSP